MNEERTGGGTPPQEDLTQLLQVRRDKLKALRDEGRDPFQITRFPVTIHTAGIRERFDELVAEERDRGAAVLLSSHVFDEVERTCDRVAFIRRGRVSEPVVTQEMKRGRRKRLRATFADAAEARAFLEEGAGAGWTARPGTGPNAVEVEVTGSMEGLVRSLGGRRVTDIETREQPLEEMFFHIYSQGNGQADPCGKGVAR